MDPEAEDPDSKDNLVPWSGSDGSQELCVSETLAESYYEDDASDAEYQSDPQSSHTQVSDDESPERRQSKDWESAGEPQYPSELSGSEEDVSYQEEDDVYLSESRESVTESPHIQSSPTSLSPHPQRPDSELQSGKISRPHSHSSSSSIGCTADMTLALTLTAEQPLGASNRQGSGTGNRRVAFSEEGGCSEAPPASVFFGISGESAEQAEKWNSESDTDLCRPDRHRARHTRLSHNESQSERQVKENKSKCKRLALLLTNAPNPQNKGALLFKKRRQRVEKFTLVSYGTGENKFDGEDQKEEETEEVRSAEYNLEASSGSDLEEEYSVYHQEHNLSLNWASLREMEALPDTKGKGVLMFDQRRKRMDRMVSDHEEKSKALHVERSTQLEPAEAQNIYGPKEMYMHPDQASYVDANFKQHVEYQENIQQMNNQSNVSRPLVPNRTAKPFLGFRDGTTSTVMPGGMVPVTKKHESRFRVPVPINTNPQVWSPTGDIIASRDERISVPAIKTGILPESKRKATNKQLATLQHESSLQHYSKGERKSYIEPEEDFFSLGAEACNFMQPKTVKLKNPPPVAPKPTINPTSQPWMRRSPSCEPNIPPRSPVLQPSQSPAGPHSQHYLEQQDWAQSQQMANNWAPDQTLQTPASAWGPVNSSSQLHLQPTTNSWSQRSPRSPVSMNTRSPTYSPHEASPLRNKSDSAPQSVASCPPQAGLSYVHESKASQASQKSQVKVGGINRAGDGPTKKGKGAELFAKRQSRMEKFVVDSETVQVNNTRARSPTSSLPNYWRYSSNVRAPPPLSYNPLLSPFYPPSAAKQPPSTSPKIKPKTKEKPKAPQKHLNALDIMKHQPYQLDSSLFKYDAVPEANSPSPGPGPGPSPGTGPGPSPSPKPTQASKFEAIMRRKQRAASSQSPHKGPELAVQSKAEVPAKSPVLVSSPNYSARRTTRSAEPLSIGEHVDEKHTVTAHHITSQQAPTPRPASASSQQSSVGDSIAAAFSPASLIARGVRQMAPRPKFSAKKPVVACTQWKPVAMLH
ncbi:synaptopodin-2 isoform X2 [Labrus mixtus]|uniref:synaptopodin-2 isoform X2 n=1 Tax=Labrus mixtus TaxID=508554 RepID=UPI0029BFF608|nr:synaptopodin-2 isoform X2 [Labrus mixtus]